MKTINLLVICILFASVVTAQNHNKYDLSNRKTYKPTVYAAPSHSGDTTYMVDEVKIKAIVDFHETHRYGYDQVEKPQFIFTGKDNFFSFAVGGTIKATASYDFGGISNAIDFIPSSISVPKNYGARQKLTMDGSTSTLYFKAIANTKALGRIVIYMDGDFRGGNPADYKPRLKTGYISFLGLTIGRDATTFCDLSSAPTTIDFAGPNAYTYTYATLIRYEHTFYKNHFRAGVALEMPNVSGTYGETFKPISQRVPNIPLYLQYMWGKNRSSHVRASAIFRELYAGNSLSEKTVSLLGWGVQLSGNIECCKWMRVMFTGVYGQGITPYIQDIAGLGLDFIPDPLNHRRLETLPMFGVQGGAQFSITPRLQTTCGLSMVQVEKHNGSEHTNPYKRGVYAFGNIFYKITPRCSVAGEYLYGSRENMDNVIGYANRINLMLQYNF